MIYPEDINKLNDILNLSITFKNKQVINKNFLNEKLKFTIEESNRLLTLLKWYNDNIEPIGKIFMYNSGNIDFESNEFTKKFIEHSGFYQLSESSNSNNTKYDVKPATTMIKKIIIGIIITVIGGLILWFIIEKLI
ncbi:MAG: hypothetical protein ISS18_12230 [Bacteroidales bacterium]|nr:hypothetical protein [Bacteroidales bacterium]